MAETSTFRTRQVQVSTTEEMMVLRTNVRLFGLVKPPRIAALYAVVLAR